MTTRLTLARQAPSVLDRLSTMCCSHHIPRDGQWGEGDHDQDTQNATGHPAWCCVPSVTSKVL